ncbi:hypothetical protein Y024_5273 [Burkholderia pseudomallei TSV44]|nr:hypothetical protein Y024_5273 [Burkholderia pseudomallei TSV44]
MRRSSLNIDTVVRLGLRQSNPLKLAFFIREEGDSDRFPQCVPMYPPRRQPSSTIRASLTRNAGPVSTFNNVLVSRCCVVIQATCIVGRRVVIGQ